jgi:uncharacterized protein (TIGR03437 family)
MVAWHGCHQTRMQSVGAGTSTVNLTFGLGGLESNPTYYYRAVAMNGGGTIKGLPLSFTTLTTLLAPALFTPANAATTVLAPPAFSWSAVTSASSYRLIVATNPGALPTDPTSPACGTGCVLDVTPVGTSYVPPGGVLAPQTTYYWEVHARSPSQFGTWSGVFRFTTGAAAGLSPEYTIGTVAGNRISGFSGDDGPAISAQLGAETAVATDAAGNLYIADTLNQRIRRVTPSGTITTVAGNGTMSFSGDGGPATLAGMQDPSGVAVDAAGNLYIAAEGNFRIRRVTPEGTITTVAGNGISGFSGDGGPAISAELANPNGVAVDAAGNLYIADQVGSYRIRRVTPAGTITTVAGNGKYGFSGDGGPATQAALGVSTGIAVDRVGNLYIADEDNYRIRRVTPAGTITTVAGNGKYGFSGDGGPATAAPLGSPSGVAVDGAGNLYIADRLNYRVRRVTPEGIITTVAGNGTPGFSGDGGPAISADLTAPNSVAVDEAGNVYIAVYPGSRIRVLQPVAGSPIISTVQNGGSFLPGVSQGSWVTIKGANLAGTTRVWTTPDFVGNSLPTMLDNVSVTINGKAAYVYFVSPGQLNVLAPADTTLGPAPVQVTYDGAASSVVSATLSAVSPALFMLDPQGRKYVAAVRSDGAFLGPSNLFSGALATVPAHPGDVILLYGTGFGPTSPATPIGTTFSTANLTASPVTVTIGGVPATVQFAGLVAPGEYQFNVVVPSVPAGDNLVVLTVGGSSSQPNAYLAAQ